MSDQPLLRPARWLDSCDWCSFQEGKHYCLRHSLTVKNMDTVRCAQFVRKKFGKAKK